VSPVEVETVLARHSGVNEAAVSEIEVRDGVSIVAAFIVPQGSRTLDPDDLISFAARHLADYKLPREVFVVTALPKTANGKLARAMLAQLADAQKDHSSSMS